MWASNKKINQTQGSSIFPFALLIIINLIGCAPNSNSDIDEHQELLKKIAITAVYKSIYESWDQYNKELNETSALKMGAPGVHMAHHTRLNKIDASLCPQDFEDAFNEFINANMKLTEIIEANQGWGSWMSNFLTLGQSSLLDAMENAPSAKREVILAKQKMDRIAMKYGLTF